MMKIRKHVPDDWLWLTDFQFWTDGVGMKMKSNPDNAMCFVAENEDGIIGFICGENTSLFGNFLIAAEVLPDYRNRGVFKAMLDEYKRHSDNTITVFHNSDLNELYHKVGFTLGEQLRVSMKEI